MKVEKNKVVSLTYELWVDDEKNERVIFDKAGQENPLTFICGTGNLLELFEENINGLQKGDSFDFSIDFVNGYGEYDEDKVILLPIDAFMYEGKVNHEILKEGNVLPMQDQMGNRLEGEILKVNEDTVQMDFNHPLAGMDLFFKGEIVEVRDADQEELAHGHVHTPGQHHH